MKLVTVTKAKKKVNTIIGSLLLIVLLSGCVTQVSRKKEVVKCSEAEAAVSQAQKQQDAAIQELDKKPKDQNTSKSAAVTTQNLAALQEKAFEACNRSGTNN